MTLILLVILAALVFTYINGFHDTANSIATVVATKVLTPRQAVMLAAVTNLVGAFMGTAVATTIASGLVDPEVATSEVLICALVAAILWNLLTWWFGMPSSSSPRARSAVCAARAWPPRTTTGMSWSGPFPIPSIGGKARACSGKSSCRWSPRPSADWFSVFCSWVCSIFCCATGVRPPSTKPSANCNSSARPTWVSATAPMTRKKPWASSLWRC